MHKITVPTVITNGHFNREKTLSEIKRSGAQRIALAIDPEDGYEFSSPENLKLLEECISYYKENGLEVLVWLGETFGHTGTPSGGKSSYTNIRNLGRGDIKAYCPMDNKLLSAFINWIISVADAGAEIILLDDDFRLGYRGGGHGCCCPLHIAALERELGEKITESELPEKVFSGGKSRYRDAWLKTQGDSIRNFSKKLRKALDEKYPNVRLGFCCSPDSWDNEGYTALEITEILAGKTRPILRLMGAPYWVTQWKNKTLGEIIEIERNQINWCKNTGIEIMTEGDTWPRPRFAAPAAYLECFDMICCADSEETGCLKYMLDYFSDADYETGFVDAAVENKENYKIIHKYFSDKNNVGVRPYNYMRLLEERDMSYDSLRTVMDSAFYASARFTAENSLPSAFDGDGVNILFGENAKYIPASLLKNGSIIDITAAKYLQKRGIDTGITDFGNEAVTGGRQEYFTEEKVYTRLDQSAEIPCFTLKEDARVLSCIVCGDQSYNGMFSYENDDGVRFTILPFDAEQAKMLLGYFSSYARRRLLIRELEWLGKKPLDAYIDGDYPECYIMVKRNDKEMVIGLWNLYQDKIKNARISVSPRFENAEFLNCKGHIEDNAVILDTTLYPYEFAGVSLKLK